MSQDGKPVTAIGEPAANGDKGDPTAPKKVEIDLTVEPSLDSLRLYLRSIGRVGAWCRLVTGPARFARSRLAGTDIYLSLSLNFSSPAVDRMQNGKPRRMHMERLCHQTTDLL